MSKSSGMPLEELRPYLFLLRDRDATKHLLRVSGGLDSLVMGEGQILAQVKQVRIVASLPRQCAVYETVSHRDCSSCSSAAAAAVGLLTRFYSACATDSGCAALNHLYHVLVQVHKVGQNCPSFGRHLNGLFKQAVTAGKRVRSETSISTGSVSVSSAAVELAQLKLPTHSWKDANVCIIGAGKMSTLLVKHLSSKGCTAITLLNRSLPRAQVGAPRAAAAAPMPGVCGCAFGRPLPSCCCWLSTRAPVAVPAIAFRNRFSGVG